MKTKKNAKAHAPQRQVSKAPERVQSPVLADSATEFLDPELDAAAMMGNQSLLDAIAGRATRAAAPPPGNPGDGGGQASPTGQGYPAPQQAPRHAAGLSFGGVQIVSDEDDELGGGSDLEGAASLALPSADRLSQAAAVPPQDGLGGGDGDGSSTTAAYGTPTGWGSPLADHRGVTAFGNGPDPGYAPDWAYQEYGYLYQCVELVNRFAAQVLGAGNLKGSGNANNYSNLNISGLTWMDNLGGPNLPGDGDILVFHGGSVGHVGIATSGSPSGVGLMQQNWGTQGTANLAVDGSEGHYTVGGLGSYTLAGWHTSGQSADQLPNLSWNRQAFIFKLATALGLDSESAESAWQSAVDRGIIEEGDPTGAITRGAAAKILAVGLGLDASIAYNQDAVVPFADTKSSDWWYPWAGACRAYGIFTGGSDNCLRGLDVLSENEADFLAQRASGGASLRSTEEQIAHLTVDPYACTEISDATGEVSTDETPTAQDTLDQAELGAAVHNLGEVEDLGENFFSVAGGLVDMLVPNVGDKRRLELGFLFPVAGGVVKLGMAFEGQIKRKDDSVILGCELGVQVVAGFSTWLGEAYVSAKLGGYMEASGDNGAECFRLMVLAIHQRIASVNDWAADLLLEPTAVDAIVAEMDANDQVSSGLDIDVSTGLETPEVGGVGVDLSAGGELRIGTMLMAENGRLSAHDVTRSTFDLNVGVGSMEVEGRLRTETQDNAWQAIEVKVVGEQEVSWDELTVLLGASHTISGLFGDLVGVVQGTSGMVTDDETARQVGSIADFIADNSGLGLGTAWGTQKALEGIPSFQGVSVGHKLSLIVESDKDEGFTIELRLDRTSSFEFGDEQSSGVHLEIESAEQVFSVKNTKAPAPVNGAW